MDDVDGMLAVDPDESEGFGQQCHLANRPDVDEGCARPQPDFGFPSSGSQVVHVIRVEHTVFVLGDVQDRKWDAADGLA